MRGRRCMGLLMGGVLALAGSAGSVMAGDDPFLAFQSPIPGVDQNGIMLVDVDLAGPAFVGTPRAWTQPDYGKANFGPPTWSPPGLGGKPWIACAAYAPGGPGGLPSSRFSGPARATWPSPT